MTWVSSFNSVDLPAPFEPMMPTASPLLTVKLTPFSAINVVPIRRWSVPMRVFGSSLPRLRAHQLCRSPRSVPPPICPKRYCFFTFSTRIINEFSRILAPPYTVSTKVFSTLLKSDSPSASSRAVQISDDAHMTPVTCPVPKKI